jgi:AcrR family transcriptional regulator
VDARREQLLDAGVSLFATRSWDEVSIEEIAAACGVSRGLLYHYFSGKRDYYVATIEHALERLHVVDPDPELPPGEQLLVGLERFFESLEQHPELHAALRRVAPADIEVAAILERDHEAFAQRVLAGLPSAAGGSPLARATARAWIGAVETAGLRWLERRDVPAEQLIEVLADALVAAMLAAARLDPAIELPPGIEELRGGGEAAC